MVGANLCRCFILFVCLVRSLFASLAAGHWQLSRSFRRCRTRHLRFHLFMLWLRQSRRQSNCRQPSFAPAACRFDIFGNVFERGGHHIDGACLHIEHNTVFPCAGRHPRCGDVRLRSPLKDLPFATLRQLLIPSVDIAAAMRAYLVVAYAGLLLGMLIAPIACAAFGSIDVMLVAGAIYLIVAVIGWMRLSDRHV